MPKAEVTPTTIEDAKTFFPFATPCRIRALTIKIDGEIKGIGGYAILPSGDRWAFVSASEDDCRRYPYALQRAAHRLLKEMKSDGIRRIVASCDPKRGAAPRWLRRLGFNLTGHINGQDIYTYVRT